MEKREKSALALVAAVNGDRIPEFRRGVLA
jgi:hypothetical protein